VNQATESVGGSGYSDHDGEPGEGTCLPVPDLWSCSAVTIKLWGTRDQRYVSRDEIDKTTGVVGYTGFLARYIGELEVSKGSVGIQVTLSVLRRASAGQS